MKKEESENIDLNQRELIKLQITRNVLSNALQTLENGDDPKVNFKLQLDECQNQIKILEEIIKEPLFILEQKDISDDLSKIFLRVLLRLDLDEEVVKYIEKEMIVGRLITPNDTAQYFKYYNYLSFLCWKRDREKDVGFWKQVAVENAKINNTPYEVANETLKALDKQLEDSSRYTKIRF